MGEYRRHSMHTEWQRSVSTGGVALQDHAHSVNMQPWDIVRVNGLTMGRGMANVCVSTFVVISK